jgi:hypothetical protein
MSAELGRGGGERAPAAAEDLGPPPDLVRGLVNNGNTCFFNSVLQGLATVPPAHEWLRSIAAVGDGAGEGDGGVSLRLLALLRALSWPLSSSGEAVRHTLPVAGGGGVGPSAAAGPGKRAPIHPRLALGSLSSYFERTGGQQHDAHELLVALLATVDGGGVGSSTASDAVDAVDAAGALRALALRQRKAWLAGQLLVPSSVRPAAPGGLRAWAQSRVRRSSHTATTAASTVTPSTAAALANPFACLVGRRTECLACREVLPVRGKGNGGAAPLLASSSSSAPAWVLTPETVITLHPPETSPHFLQAGGGGRVGGGGAPAVSSVESLLRAYFMANPTSGWVCSNPACSHIAHAPGPRVAGAGGSAGGGAMPRPRLPYNALRWTALLRAPPALVLHVNRLQPGYKNAAHVDFDLTLDLRPFTLGGLVSGGAGAGRRTAAARTAAPPSCTTYRLTAVVVHLGGPFSGHYVTHRRVPCPVREGRTAGDVGGGAVAGDAPRASTRHLSPAFLPQWSDCSDASVRPSDEDTARCAEAYLLFYVREDVLRDREAGLVAASGDVLLAGGEGGGLAGGAAEVRHWLRTRPADLLGGAAWGKGLRDTGVCCFPVE